MIYIAYLVTLSRRRGLQILETSMFQVENPMDDKIDERLIIDNSSIDFPSEELQEKKSPLIKIVAIAIVLMFMFGGLLIVLANIGII